jgi:hypothetical protein
MASKGTCKAQGCEKDVRAKGYCDRHYRKWRKGLLAKPRHRTCVAEGCSKARVRRALCLEHFEKQHSKTKGDAAPAASAPPAA